MTTESRRYRLRRRPIQAARLSFPGGRWRFLRQPAGRHITLVLGALTIIAGTLAAVLKIQQHDERYFPYLLLPVAKAGDHWDRHPHDGIYLTITAAGRLFDWGREIDAEELDRILLRVGEEYGARGVPIIISADRRVDFDVLRSILRLLAIRQRGPPANYLHFMIGNDPLDRIMLPCAFAPSEREFPPGGVLFHLGANGWRIGERQFNDVEAARVLVRLGELDSRTSVHIRLEPDMTFRRITRAILFSNRAGLTPTFLIDPPLSAPP